MAQNETLFAHQNTPQYGTIYTEIRGNVKKKYLYTFKLKETFCKILNSCVIFVSGAPLFSIKLSFEKVLAVDQGVFYYFLRI